MIQQHQSAYLFCNQIDESYLIMMLTFVDLLALTSIINQSINQSIDKFYDQYNKTGTSR